MSPCLCGQPDSRGPGAAEAHATLAAVEEKRPGFSWSVSRHDTFTRCRRRYYYSYYGAYEDPEIKRLKRLSALPLWAGNVVHEEIEKFLKQHDALPPEAEREALIRSAVHERMLAEWNQSEARGEFRLFEHEYDVPVEQEDKKILVGTVMRSLRNFFCSPTLAEAFAAGRDAWLTIEDLVSYPVGNVPVYLRMDLAFHPRPLGRSEDERALERDLVRRTAGLRGGSGRQSTPRESLEHYSSPGDVTRYGAGGSLLSPRGASR